MPYYRAGDYYRGDYYRGDLFGFVKKIGGAALGLISKGALGPLPALLAGAAQHPKTAGRVIAAGGALLPGPTGLAISATGTALSKVAERFEEPPVSMMNYPATNGGYGGGGMAVMCPTKGTRMNKSTYVTRGGGTSRWPSELIVHPKGTECVKSRRLNVANPRALRRALRRAAGFVKLARRAHVRLSSFTGRKTARKRK